MHRVPLAAPLLAALATLTPTASASGTSVRVLYYTHSTSAGSAVVASAAVAGRATQCTGTLSYGTSAVQATARVKRHRVSLRWTTAASPSTSQAALTIACPESGSATVHLTIRGSLIPATVTVGKSGFSLSTDLDQINYGAVLTNPSPNQDALNVQMTANFLSASGQIVATDVFTLSDVPAGSTFYYGGSTSFSAVNPTPTTMQLTTLVGSQQRAANLPVAPMTNLQAIPDDFLGTQIQGQFSNPYTKTLTTLTAITYTVFDTAGNVISGGITFSNAEVPPNGQLGFQTFDESLSSSSVGSISASLSPDFG